MLLSVVVFAACSGSDDRSTSKPSPPRVDRQCAAYAAPDRVGFGGRIALTFDDGPSELTPEVIDVLHAHDAPATFFAIGSVLDRYEPGLHQHSLAALIADPRYTVGNHTWSHANLPRLSFERALEEIFFAELALESHGAAPTWFRFPYGRATCGLREYVEITGRRWVGWHVESADWCFEDGECSPTEFSMLRNMPAVFHHDMLAFILHQLEATGGGIVLFHDVHQRTARVLDEILTTLESHGYELTSLDDSSTFPVLNGDASAPKRIEAHLGDPCAEHADCDLNLPAYLGYCADTGYCTRACEETCPSQDFFCVPRPGRPGIGYCAARPTDHNEQCAAYGLDLVVRERFGGVTPRRATVCGSD